MKQKNEQVEPIIDWINALKARHKIQVKILRCDNVGENKVLLVERVFVTVMGRARAMMNHAGLTMAKRQQLWCEAIQTATLLDNILVKKSAKSPPLTQFFGVDATYDKQIKVFGEMCAVGDTDNKVGRTKIDPRCKVSLIVGYSTRHAGDVYRLLNHKMSRVIHSRDVKRNGKTLVEFYKITMVDRASGYVDPDKDFQLAEEYQDIDEEESEPEEDDSDAIQVGQPQEKEPTDTPIGVADDEPVASCSQTAIDVPIEVRTRQAYESPPEMSAFSDVKEEKILNEWFIEISENESDITMKNQQGQHYMHANYLVVYPVQKMNEK